MLPESMRALRLHERGGPERIRCEEAPLPFVGLGDALLRVRAASFTPTELSWPETWIDRAGRQRLPVIPGHEASGEVVALGAGASGASVGDEVYAITDWYRDGTAAEYVAVEVRNLAPKPAALDHRAAATVPLAGLTAWEALFRHGGLEAGQTVLIHGAGGGVGTFAVQLAAAAGARVVATARGWARELVLGLGADIFVDVERERFENAGGATVVLDLVGGELLARSWAMVGPGGVLVSAVESSLKEAATAHRVRALYFVVEPSRAGLVDLARRIDAGDLRPIVGDVLALERGREAFERKRRGGAPGKTVLTLDAPAAA
jgi:NADPH:quinone reductase-like Zn-dependent oxidoreductase